MMPKHTAVGALLVSVVCVFMVWAPASAQIPKGQKVGLVVYLKAAYAGLKSNLTSAARQMPEADYGFKPSTMPEMRGYGQLFAHVAAGQFSACAAMKGTPDPARGRNLEQEATTKTAILDVLADSFAFCADAVAALTDQNAMDLVRQGEGDVARSAVLAGLLAHNSEMYGISTVYLRARNLVPPSSRARARGGRP
jgi:DinB superfamily